jgi:4-amino-4-deoxy-L-arabinose transferase-like glycosyltransferase
MPISQRPAPQISADEQALRRTLLGLLAVTAARLIWLRLGGLDLYPDEAQYWLWSLTPDWGYFSKPPLIAWVIRATTLLLGDDEAAIRLASPLFHFGTALVIFQIARRLYDSRTASWSAIAYATLPGVSASSLVISTDVPLLFCWAVALYGFVRAREPRSARWWILVGVAAGFGLLAKYAMAYWLLSALLFLLAVKDERRHLPRFLVASTLALTIYAPNLLWNVGHDFASYRHTEANAGITGLTLHPGAFGEFLGSQFGVFGPVFFATLLAIVVLLRHALADRRAQLLAIFALPTLAMMIAVSLLSRAHPNWSAPTYISATILVVAYLIEHGRAVLVTGSVIFHVALAAVLLPARDIAHAVGWDMPGSLDPVHRLRGWALLGNSVSALLREQSDVRLLSDNREVLAALIYYVAPHPFDAVKWNPGGRIHDQFDMFADAKSHVGENFLLVSPRRGLGDLSRYFADIGSVGHITINLGGGTTREFLVVRLDGFKGY